MYGSMWFLLNFCISTDCFASLSGVMRYGVPDLWLERAYCIMLSFMAGAHSLYH